MLVCMCVDLLITGIHKSNCSHESFFFFKVREGETEKMQIMIDCVVVIREVSCSDSSISTMNNKLTFSS